MPFFAQQHFMFSVHTQKIQKGYKGIIDIHLKRDLFLVYKLNNAIVCHHENTCINRFSHWWTTFSCATACNFSQMRQFLDILNADISVSADSVLLLITFPAVCIFYDPQLQQLHTVAAAGQSWAELSSIM